MTIKARKKICRNCKGAFIEDRRDSNLQWSKRLYCSIKCNNSSSYRFESIFSRLERFQVKKDGCWGWTGNSDEKGYGALSSRLGSLASPEKAHRVSYEMSFGVAPGDLVVRHKCDNPPCTNPAHLELGTQKDNMQDMVARGRMSPISLLNLNRRKSLSDEQVKEILSMKLAGKNGRGGITKKQLASIYKVHPETILNSIRRHENAN